jgi:hypothetical protein
MTLAVLVLTASACSAAGRWVEAPHDWALSSTEANVLTIQVVVGSSECNRYSGVETFETDTEVSIEAIVATRVPGVMPFGCTDDLVFETVESLRKHLGREVSQAARRGDAMGFRTTLARGVGERPTTAPRSSRGRRETARARQGSP